MASPSRWIAGALALMGALLLAAPAHAGLAKIIGGDPAQIAEFPHQAQFWIDTPDGWSFCGGTLVTPTVVLTAAHCVTDDAGALRPVGASEVVLGQTTLSGTWGEVIPVDSYLAHEDFDPVGYANDVALLRLSAPSSQTPMSLVEPGEQALWTPGTAATVIGWGATALGGPISDQLMEVQVPIVSDGVCSSGDPLYADLAGDVMLCAGLAAGGKDSCQGDSGGPLLVPYGTGYRLAGIVSWGINCAEPNRYGVYTEIGNAGLRAWIVEHAFGGVPVGLQNPGFEQGLDDWTAHAVVDGVPQPASCAGVGGDAKRGVCGIGSDSFTAGGQPYDVDPADGAAMVRLGGPFTGAADAQPLDRYVLRQTFTVDPANPKLAVSSNVFTFDDTGADELRIGVRVTDDQGASIVQEVHAGEPGDTTLKTTGWQTDVIDLTAYAGQQVHLSIDAGGAGGDRAFWAYVDAGTVPAEPGGGGGAPAGGGGGGGGGAPAGGGGGGGGAAKPAADDPASITPPPVAPPPPTVVAPTAQPVAPAAPRESKPRPCAGMSGRVRRECRAEVRLTRALAECRELDTKAERRACRKLARVEPNGETKSEGDRGRKGRDTPKGDRRRRGKDRAKGDGRREGRRAGRSKAKGKRSGAKAGAV